jgi:hypothetical protein
MAKHNDLAQQDALTNAFLAIFAVMLLLLVQTGLDDVVARLEAQALGAMPDDVNEPTGGPRALTVVPRADVAVILAPPQVDVRVTGAAGKLVKAEGDLSAGAATMWQFQRDSADLPQSVRVQNTGPATAEVTILLDGAWVAGQPARLAAQESVYLLLCPKGTGYAFRRPGGRC